MHTVCTAWSEPVKQLLKDLNIPDMKNIHKIIITIEANALVNVDISRYPVKDEIIAFNKFLNQVTPDFIVMNDTLKSESGAPPSS
jgi:hypothetical protein